MIGWNANAAHQYINLAQAALAGLLLESGCKQVADNTVDCSASYIPPQYTAWAMLALVVLKFVINIGRDGVSGLFKVQPPVADEVKTLTIVSPADTKVEVSTPGGGLVDMNPAAAGASPKPKRKGK